MNRFKNIRINDLQCVAVRNEGNESIRLETENEGCRATVFMTYEQTRKLAENLLKATIE